MTDKKLTGSEIVKALKEILEIMLTMGDLQKASTISKALDLINRLQAENERLKEEKEGLEIALINTRDNLGDTRAELNKTEAENERLKQQIEDKGGFILIADAKAEAYKEFAKRLKHKAINIGVNDSIVSTFAIDEILKELVKNK